MTEAVQYVAGTYTLMVNQTGLPSGDAWSVTIGGKTYNTTMDSISIHLVSGNYNVSVTGPSGYTVSMHASNVTVSDGNATFSVAFSAPKSTASSAGSLYAGIGIGGIVGAAAAVFGTMFYTGTGVFRRPGE